MARFDTIVARSVVAESIIVSNSYFSQQESYRAALAALDSRVQWRSPSAP